jgi:Transposase
VNILRRMCLKTARAWAIKEAATKLWTYVKAGWAAKAWKKWIGWAMRSRIDPIKAATRTIRDHLWGIVNAVVNGASNAVAESTNAKIQKVKRQACGFRNREGFRMAIRFHLGGLEGTRPLPRVSYREACPTAECRRMLAGNCGATCPLSLTSTVASSSSPARAGNNSRIRASSTGG